MKMTPAVVVSLALGSVWPAWADGIAVGYSNCVAVASLSQAEVAQIAQLRWFFAHASVGQNMRDGVSDLLALNATRYLLRVVSDDAAPPAVPSNGVVYAYNRGNPGWQAKTADFTAYVQNGWRFPRVNLAVNKFCYIDQAADASVYLNAMRSLETNDLKTVFVYMTMPLTTSQDSENYLRSLFNAAVRAWVATNNGVLFDIADMESRNTEGVSQTYVHSGRTCERLYSGYTTDGGHLNDAGNAGRDLVAKGFYALAAALFRADRDGDGASDGQELIAGTSPLVPSDSFRVSGIALATNGPMRLSWPSASNRVYAVRQAAGPSAAWSDLVTNISATPPGNTHSVTNTEAGGQRFYRLSVQQ